MCLSCCALFLLPHVACVQFSLLSISALLPQIQLFHDARFGTSMFICAAICFVPSVPNFCARGEFSGDTISVTILTREAGRPWVNCGSLPDVRMCVTAWQPCLLFLCARHR